MKLPTAPGFAANFISREEALKSGVARFFTGEPCRKGHVAERYAPTNDCVECVRLRASAYSAKHRVLKEPTLPKVETAEERDARNAKRRAARQASEQMRLKEAVTKREKRQLGLWVDDKEKMNARTRAYKKRNPEKQQQITEKRRLEGRSADATARYRYEHPDRAKATDHRQRAKRTAAMGFYTESDLRRIRHEQSGRCAACGFLLLGDEHVDHIVPISKGGTNWHVNIQLLCPTCNLRKSDMSYDAFLAKFDMEPYYVKEP